MPGKYIFKSERLGFRSWNESDLEDFAELNSSKEVMEFFPKPLSKTETAEFLDRLQKHYKKHAYCYFAIEILETGEFIGFIGLAYQIYNSDFTPAVDIGWRIKKSAWGNGYATEGAKRCLDYAKEDLKLERLISTCPAVNKRSEGVMQKIGMSRIGEFDHPNLKDYPELQKCLCYQIEF